MKVEMGQTVRYRVRNPEDRLTYFSAGVVVLLYPITIFDLTLNANVEVSREDILGFHVAEAS